MNGGYSKNIDVKNILTQEALDENTLFEACSLSKPVFVYFVNLLAGKGIIELDTPLYTYYKDPEITDGANYRLMTARMVLCNASHLSFQKKSVAYFRALGGKLQVGDFDVLDVVGIDVLVFHGVGFFASGIGCCHCKVRQSIIERYREWIVSSPFLAVRF